MDDIKISINLATLKEIKQIMDFVEPLIPPMEQPNDIGFAYITVLTRLKTLQIQCDALNKIMNPVIDREETYV